MSIRLNQQSGHNPFRRVASVWALCLFTTVACGGHAIPIGGEPLDTDETDTTGDTTTQDTTAADSNDGNTSDATGGNNTSGGGSTGSDPNPPGISCTQYPACDVNTPCAAGDCMAFAECGTAICIPGEEACKLSCPDVEQCLILESYPSQLACEGKVPAIPGVPAKPDECTIAGGKCLTADQSAPPTFTVGNYECTNAGDKCWVPLPDSSEPSEPTFRVSCENYTECDAETPCVTGQECIAFPEIGAALCIDWQEACKLSCPDPESCTIAESYPAQLGCPDRIDATCSVGGGTNGDAGAPDGVDCEAHETCDALDPCDEGSCIKVPGCDAPLCIDSELACKETCGANGCAIAESYPEQLFCDDETEPGQDPDQPVSSNDAGVSVPGWPGPDAGDAGQ